MATVNNPVVPNFPAASSLNIFNCVWKLTRAMKKAGYKYVASSDGVTKDTSGDPELDKWGVGTISNIGGSSADISAPTRGRATVAGLSGIVASDKGRFLKISGAATAANNHMHQIEEVLSSSAVRIDARTFAVASDVNNGALVWEIRDPLGTSYPGGLDSVQAWLLLRGASTLKVPITTPPVAGVTGYTFIRGENIVQATTGFEGEILGYVFNAGTGYLVVSPRLRGTGGGVFGLATGNQFTGGISGATITQDGTALEYRREIVFWKQNNLTQGSIFHSAIEPVGETSFSSLIGTAGCTATIAPGGGGTGNAFPTFAYVQAGTSTGGHFHWVGSTASASIGNSQIMCADLIEEQGYSADGSFIFALGNTNIAGGGHIGFWFQRMDDTEDGDLDPFVSMGMTNSTLYTGSRTAPIVGTNAVETFSSGTATMTTGNGQLRGWRNRGLASGDAFQEFEYTIERTVQSSTGGAPTGSICASNPSSVDRVATAPVPTRIREPIGVVSIQVGAKMRKGRCRWLSWTQGGNGCDLLDSRRLIQLTSTVIPMVGGPWDGSSIPSQA